MQMFLVLAQHGGRIMKLANLVEEIETTLQQERKSYADGDETDENIKGWIEALEYVLRQIEVLH